MRGDYLILNPLGGKSSAERNSDEIHKERLERKNNDGSFSNEGYRDKFFNPVDESFGGRNDPFDETSSTDQSTARQQHDRGIKDEDYRERKFRPGTTAEELRDRLSRSNKDRPDPNQPTAEEVMSNLAYLKSLPESGGADQISSNLDFLNRSAEESDPSNKIHGAIDFGGGSEQFSVAQGADDFDGSEMVSIIDRLATVESRITHFV